MVNTREIELAREPYVLPSQCEQVFYSEVLGKAGWSYIIRRDPRGRLIKYNAKEEYNVEEKGDVDQEQLAVDIDVLDEEFDQEVDHPNDVADNEIDIDDIDDDYLTEHDTDHYPDMTDIFNDSDSEPDDDTDVELDE